MYSLVQTQRITDGNVTECEWGKQSAPAFYSGVLKWYADALALWFKMGKASMDILSLERATF